MNMEIIIALAVIVGAMSGAAGFVVGWRDGRGLEGLLLGTILGPLGLILFAFMDGGRRECPTCFEIIDVRAKRCGHCGEAVPSEAGELNAETQTAQSGQGE